MKLCMTKKATQSFHWNTDHLKYQELCRNVIIFYLTLGIPLWNWCTCIWPVYELILCVWWISLNLRHCYQKWSWEHTILHIWAVSEPFYKKWHSDWYSSNAIGFEFANRLFSRLHINQWQKCQWTLVNLRGLQSVAVRLCRPGI
jgi:hypothetical protein